MRERGNDRDEEREMEFWSRHRCRPLVHAVTLRQEESSEKTAGKREKSLVQLSVNKMRQCAMLSTFDFTYQKNIT